MSSSHSCLTFRTLAFSFLLSSSPFTLHLSILTSTINLPSKHINLKSTSTSSTLLLFFSFSFFSRALSLSGEIYPLSIYHPADLQLTSPRLSPCSLQSTTSDSQPPSLTILCSPYVGFHSCSHASQISCVLSFLIVSHLTASVSFRQ